MNSYEVSFYGTLATMLCWEMRKTGRKMYLNDSLLNVLIRSRRLQKDALPLLENGAFVIGERCSMPVRLNWVGELVNLDGFNKNCIRRKLANILRSAKST